MRSQLRKLATASGVQLDPPPSTPSSGFTKKPTQSVGRSKQTPDLNTKPIFAGKRPSHNFTNNKIAPADNPELPQPENGATGAGDEVIGDVVGTGTSRKATGEDAVYCEALRQPDVNSALRGNDTLPTGAHSISNKKLDIADPVPGLSASLDRDGTLVQHKVITPDQPAVLVTKTSRTSLPFGQQTHPRDHNFFRDAPPQIRSMRLTRYRHPPLGSPRTLREQRHRRDRPYKLGCFQARSDASRIQK